MKIEVEQAISMAHSLNCLHSWLSSHLKIDIGMILLLNYLKATATQPWAIEFLFQTGEKRSVAHLLHNNRNFNKQCESQKSWILGVSNVDNFSRTSRRLFHDWWPNIWI